MECEFCYKAAEYTITFCYGRMREICSAPVCFVRCMMETPKEDQKHIDQVNIHSVEAYRE
jgi:hypothetical protein